MRKLLLITLLFASCGPVRDIALEPVGIVVGATPNSVDVCFEASSGYKGQGCTTYTLKGGHEYQKGDRYPDPFKYDHFKHIKP